MLPESICSWYIIWHSFFCLVFCLPLGSVLDSLVFTMYTRPLGIIAQRYVVKYMLYADDTQLCISLDPDNELNFSASLKYLENCIPYIRLWMTHNLLKLNYTKIYIIFLYHHIMLIPWIIAAQRNLPLLGE